VADAFGMIGEDFDHPAFGNAAVAALLEHGLKLGLEHRQSLYPHLDFLKLHRRNPIRSFA